MSREKQIDCVYRDKVKLSKDEIGLNKKLIHPRIERMMCMTCMGEYFEMTEEEFIDLIQRFKRRGCPLFG